MTAELQSSAAPGETVYRGRHTVGGALVTVEDGVGRPLGVLRHVVRHSPSGLSWGYGGSGPADLARSLLLDALGAAAVCRECAGTGRIVWSGTDDKLEVRPYEHSTVVDELSWVDQCPACEDGDVITASTYQAFKWEVIARLPQGQEWRLTRSEVLGWWHAHRRSEQP